MASRLWSVLLKLEVKVAGRIEREDGRTTHETNFSPYGQGVHEEQLYDGDDSLPMLIGRIPEFTESPGTKQPENIESWEETRLAVAKSKTRAKDADENLILSTFCSRKAVAPLSGRPRLQLGDHK